MWESINLVKGDRRIPALPAHGQETQGLSVLSYAVPQEKDSMCLAFHIHEKQVSNSAEALHMTQQSSSQSAAALPHGSWNAGVSRSASVVAQNPFTNKRHF